MVVHTVVKGSGGPVDRRIWRFGTAENVAENETYEQPLYLNDTVIAARCTLVYQPFLFEHLLAMYVQISRFFCSGKCSP